MVNASARIFSSKGHFSGVNLRLRISFLRLWAKPACRSSKNLGRSESGIIGFGCISIVRMAESTLGAGLKCEGGTLATILGVPNSWTCRARTLKLPGLAQIF